MYYQVFITGNRVGVNYDADGDLNFYSGQSTIYWGLGSTYILLQDDGWFSEDNSPLIVLESVFPMG